MKKLTNISNVNTAMQSFWENRNTESIDMNVYTGWFVMFVEKTFETRRTSKIQKQKYRYVFKNKM